MKEVKRPEILEMESWPGRMVGFTITETKSPSPSATQPRKSKPEPRLVTVVGTKVQEKVNMGLASATRGTD